MGRQRSAPPAGESRPGQRGSGRDDGAWLGAGRPLPPPVARELRRLLGRRCSLDGLARLFRPSFPGVRTFIIQPRVAPDRAVEITLVGITREGRPVWTGSRAFVQGRDGSLEIQRGFEEIEPAHQHRNITVDLIRRELELLELTQTGPAARLTIDAEGVGRYLCALHGFVFADETDEGPPVRSNRPFAPEGDRARLIAAAEAYLEATGARMGLGRIAIEGAIEQARRARTAWELARLAFAGVAPVLAEGSDGANGVTRLGREFLLHRDTPPWRAALYLEPRDRRVREAGDAYRDAKTRDSRARLEAELADALAALEDTRRARRLRGLEVLRAVGRTEHLSSVEALTTISDRRVVGMARRTARAIRGDDLVDRMKAFVSSPRREERWRALVLRVLAEHHSDQLGEQVDLLRVDPDPRIQRAVVPVVAAAAQAPAELAAMLAANPGDEHRPGLAALRLELIERLADIADPMTLPVLLEAYREAGDDPAETLALSRALVAFQDPRARQALSEAVRSFERPPLP